MGVLGTRAGVIGKAGTILAVLMPDRRWRIGVKRRRGMDRLEIGVGI